MLLIQIIFKKCHYWAGIQPQDWKQGLESDKTVTEKQSQLQPEKGNIIVFAASQYVTVTEE